MVAVAKVLLISVVVSVHVTEYLVGFVCALLFLNVATKWPKLMKEWKDMEFNMRNYEVPKGYLKRFYLMFAITVYFIIRK